MLKKHICIGITGNIGSGKTTLLNIIKNNYNTVLYYSDIKAKYLLQNNLSLKNKLLDYFGAKSYIGDKINKDYISKIIFNDKKKLYKLNSIILPYMIKDFYIFKKKNINKIIIKESANLINIKELYNLDFLISIISSEDKKINRILKRSNYDEIKIKSILKSQNHNLELIKKSDFIIINNSSIKSAINKLKIIFQNIEKYIYY